MSEAFPPFFFICGAMRSGTTTLARLLAEHPKIHFVPEPGVQGQPSSYYPFTSPSFASSALGESGEVYRLIASATGAAADDYVADRRAYFMYYPHVAFNLREHLPHVRLIFILRNPLETVCSAFHNEPHYYAEFASFDAYVDVARGRVFRAASWKRRHAWTEHFWPLDSPASATLPLLLERGFYYQQLLRFYRLFERRQLLVLSTRHLARDPTAVARRCFTFLGLDPVRLSYPRQRMNASPARAVLTDRTRDFLLDLYGESNEKLFELVGWREDWGG